MTDERNQLVNKILMERIGQLNVDVASLQADAQILSTENQKLSNDLTQKIQQILDTDEKVKELQKAFQDYAELQKEVARLTAENRGLNERLEARERKDD